MRIAAVILTGAALLTTAGAPRPARDELARAINGRVAGKPVTCISLANIGSSRIIPGTAIVYEVGNRLYVNRPRGGGDWLRDDDILVTRTSNAELCRLDTVRLVDRATQMEHGFVVLDDFVPYTKPALRH